MDSQGLNSEQDGDWKNKNVTMRALSQQGHGPGDKDVAGYKKREPRFVVLFFCNRNSLIYGKSRRTVQI